MIICVSPSICFGEKDQMRSRKARKAPIPPNAAIPNTSIEM